MRLTVLESQALFSYNIFLPFNLDERSVMNKNKNRQYQYSNHLYTVKIFGAIYIHYFGGLTVHTISCVL